MTLTELASTALDAPRATDIPTGLDSVWSSLKRGKRGQTTIYGEINRGLSPIVARTTGLASEKGDRFIYGTAPSA